MTASLSFAVTADHRHVRVRRGPALGADDWLLVQAEWGAVGPNPSAELLVPVPTFKATFDWLTRWPHPDVAWDSQALLLVQQAVDERAALNQTLDTVGAPADPLREVGGRWTGDLNEAQRRNAGQLLSLAHGANCSVPGAGKTRTTLAQYENLRSRGLVDRLLVVAPKAAMESWQEEAHGCLSPAPDLAVFHRDVPPGVEILVVNYQKLANSLGKIRTWAASGRTHLVLDEAHRMKRGAAGLWGATCLDLGPVVVRRDILTGTPAPHGVNDLLALFEFLWPGQARTIVTDDSAQNLPALAERLRPLYVRTGKRELELPPMTLRRREVAPASLHADLYRALTGHYAGELSPSAQADFGRLGRISMYLLMAATNPKLLLAGSDRFDPVEFRVPALTVPTGTQLSEALAQLQDFGVPAKYAETATLVAENAQHGRKTLVWSFFVRNLTSLDRLLRGYRPAMVHGGVKDRAEQLRRFREDDDCSVLLANPASLGEGVSLHHWCHDAVYLERTFAAGMFMQSVDRIHRLGLAPDVQTNVTLLTTPGTVDDIVSVRLDAKIEAMGKMLDDPVVNQLADPTEEASTVGDLDLADVEAMLAHLLP